MRRALAAAVLLVAAVAAALVVLVQRGSKSNEAVAPPAVHATLAPGVLPRPGVHRYAQSGFEEAKGGPLKIHRAFPREAILVVSGTRDVVQEEWRYSKQHLEATRTRVTATGRYSIWQRIADDGDHAGRGARCEAGHAVAAQPAARRPALAAGLRGRRSAERVAQPRPRSLRRRLLRRRRGLDRLRRASSETTGLTVRETIDRHIGGTFPYRMHLEERLIR